MIERKLFLRKAIIAALAASTVPAMPLAAQETDAAAADDRSIEVIVVTAQKREQNLQDVPMVVTALSGKLLEDAGVDDIKSLSILTPGLIVTSTASEAATTARIRGIGTVGDNPGLESSVGVVIDGVYRPRNGVAFGDLGDLERIEVLKGPQGTLFGKNTSAGVINVVTRKPSHEFNSSTEVTGGSHGTMEGAASINGSLSDQLAGRLYVATREHDGFYDVSTGDGPRTLDNDSNRNSYTARGQLLFTSAELCADEGRTDGALCRGAGERRRRCGVSRSLCPPRIRQSRQYPGHHRRRRLSGNELGLRRTGTQVHHSGAQLGNAERPGHRLQQR
jgi:iron complex outermembrane recepter protein